MSNDNNNNSILSGLLADAVAKAQRQSTERRERVVAGSHLLPKLLELACQNGRVVEEKTGFHHVRNATDAASGGHSKQVCIARRGGNVTFVGFTVEHPAVVQLSAEQAKEKHLGRARGQVDFSKTDDEILEAVTLAFAVLDVPSPAPVKVKRAPKPAAEAPAAVEVPATVPAAEPTAPAVDVPVATDVPTT